MRALITVLWMLLVVAGACKKDDNPPKQGNTDTTHTDTINRNFVAPAITDMVMYEVNLRSVSDNGDFNGVTARLDAIKELGVNVLWLMPIFPVGQINSVGKLGSPYSVQNYTEVNPEFGTLAEFKNLVTEAHKRHMAVVLDWVANHTAWDNPWIDNKAWYTQDAAGNIIIPAGTNWQDVADLNYTNADMRLEMIKSMQYWVHDTHVDGFRCDAADFVPFAFWKQAIDSLKNTKENIILLAEGARNDHFTAGFQMTYGWDFYNKMVSIFSKNETASAIFGVHASEYAAIPAGRHKLRFITNHDEYAWTNSVVTEYVSKEGSLAAFVTTAFLSTVPLIYAGQEIAQPTTIPFFEQFPLDWSLNGDISEQYKILMQVRAVLPSVHKGTVTSYPDANVIAFRRTLDTENVLVFVNVRNKEISYKVPQALVGTAVNNLLSTEGEVLTEQMTLKAFEYKIYKY